MVQREGGTERHVWQFHIGEASGYFFHSIIANAPKKERVLTSLYGYGCRCDLSRTEFSCSVQTFLSL